MRVFVRFVAVTVGLFGRDKKRATMWAMQRERPPPIGDGRWLGVNGRLTLLAEPVSASQPTPEEAVGPPDGDGQSSGGSGA